MVVKIFSLMLSAIWLRLLVRVRSRDFDRSAMRAENSLLRASRSFLEA